MRHAWAPAALPGTVRIGPGRIALAAVPAPNLAEAIVDTPTRVLEVTAGPTQWTSLEDAIASPEVDLLDLPHLAAAGAGLAARLCGQEPSVLGWRWSLRLCATLFGQPPGGWHLAVDRGIDPSSAPLWVTCAAVWASLKRSCSKTEELEQLKRDMGAPLPGEQLWASAMPRLSGPAEADRRSPVARQRRARRNMRAVSALRSGQIR